MKKYELTEMELKVSILILIGWFFNKKDIISMLKSDIVSILILIGWFFNK